MCKTVQRTPNRHKPTQDDMDTCKWQTRIAKRTLHNRKTKASDSSCENQRFVPQSKGASDELTQTATKLGQVYDKHNVNQVRPCTPRNYLPNFEICRFETQQCQMNRNVPAMGTAISNGIITIIIKSYASASQTQDEASAMHRAKRAKQITKHTKDK